MARVCLILILISGLAAGGARADLIGLFADESATECAADFPLYLYTNVHVIAVLTGIEAITGAEFRIEAPELLGDYNVWSWNSPVIIGEDPLGDGIRIVFSTPVNGPLVRLGYVQVFPIVEMEPDRLWCVYPHRISELLILLDENGDAHPAYGWCFVANCTPGGPYGGCYCGILPPIPVEETGWGQVKALY